MLEASAELQALAQEAQLVDAGFDILSAARSTSSAGEGSPPEFALSIRFPDPAEAKDGEPRSWQYGLRMTVTTEVGTVIVEPVATYQVSADHESLLQQPALTEFANEVAVIALLPYARQALQDLASQVLRQQIVMPSFPRGAVTFPVPAEPDSTDPAAE